MKKILFFFIFLLLLGCAADKQQYNIVSCPDILFSKENRVYITSTQQPITNENLDYRAIINNLSLAQKVSGIVLILAGIIFGFRLFQYL